MDRFQEMFKSLFKAKFDESVNRIITYPDLNMKELWLIGSYARETYTGKSDIDLILIPKQEPTFEDRYDYAQLLDQNNFPKVDLIIRDENYLKSGTSAFSRNFLREGIKIYG